ncbi:MAG TPA: hypothetical protein VED22_07795 [Nitrososphaerales archaeon]|nr:hypothetical protein [Nitrososphaerales archaeon]
MFSSLLSNVPLGTADFLAYIMLILVGMFLISGASITYYYWRKTKRARAAMPTGSA